MTFAVQNYFFPSAIKEWNKLDVSIRKSESLMLFKKHLLEFIRPKPNSIFDINNPIGIKYLTRLRLGLSHLKEHKFRHCFQDSVDPLCNCGNGIESTKHFFLHCVNFNTQRKTLFDKLNNIDNSILAKNDDIITEIILFGQQNVDNNLNRLILNASIDFILSSERFSGPLF